MITILRNLVLFVAVFCIVPLGTVFAHQPQIVGSYQTVVVDPEISKAYYGQLSGRPDSFTIVTGKPFDFYVNILVPDISGQKNDVTAVISKDGDENVPLAVLGGATSTWKRFWEPFGKDWYRKGPEYKARVSAGEYVIRVWSPTNGSKYVLAIGETESFDLFSAARSVEVIPLLKHNFFHVSPVGFITSTLGWGYILVMYVLSFIFGFLYRWILKFVLRGKQIKVRVHNNIGFMDRAVRAILGIGLLIWAITTTWNPVALFFSGFCLFEALFSWCGFYAAIGRNSCPID
jgi:hypothetical protein